MTIYEAVTAIFVESIKQKLTQMIRVVPTGEENSTIQQRAF
jgi:hypothetical protein